MVSAKSTLWLKRTDWWLTLTALGLAGAFFAAALVTLGEATYPSDPLSSSKRYPADASLSDMAERRNALWGEGDGVSKAGGRYVRGKRVRNVDVRSTKGLEQRPTMPADMQRVPGLVCQKSQTRA